ncbi:hypothetical protein V6N13_059781 [Hibiscus sabdariffa]
MGQVNGCLSYFDKVPDGFYVIHGVHLYVWNVCIDLHEHGRIPSIEFLISVDPTMDLPVEVILVDRRGDPGLKELQNRVHNISCTFITTKEVVDQLAKLVCSRMGEYFIDLIGNPGCLCEPGSLLNGPSSISTPSPLCFPHPKSVALAIDFGSLAKQYFFGP